MKGNGQGFNKTSEGKLFKLLPSNFKHGTKSYNKRQTVRNLYNAIKSITDLGSVLPMVDYLAKDKMLANKFNY